MLQPSDRDSHKKETQNQGPKIIFTWGAEPQVELFMHVEEQSDGLTVTMHPGLSYQQVSRAAHDLGKHGPGIVQAWERHTGFVA